jgi:peptide-methionine (S)-S-oxide reductase
LAPKRPGTRKRSRITFDPRRISYGRILQIYFSVAHDPTELNRQGPDVGLNRSAIFRQIRNRRVLPRPIDQLNQARVFDAAIATGSNPAGISIRPRAIIRIS